MDEFSVKFAAVTDNKKYNIFKLHKDDDVTWTEAKMRRDHENHPWQIKLGSGRTGRRFKATKDGGVGDNASYYVFYKPNDQSKTYEVCPIAEWYSVSATQRYKTLTAEEAEQKFEQRHKMFNYFSVMHKKGGENGEEGGSGQDNKNFKVSELDEWDDSGNENGSGNEEGNEDEGVKKNRRKNKAKKEKEDLDDAPDEAKEESDEGDFEQREVDYMSDTSSSSDDEEEEKRDETDVRGIAEEEALRDLLDTDEEEEVETGQQKTSRSSNNKSALGTVDIKQDPDENGSEDSSDSDDYDIDEEKMDSLFMKKGMPTLIKQEVKQEVEPSTSRQQATNNKRKIASEVTTAPPQPAKRPCTTESYSTQASGQEKIIEDLIIKYLSRKPMTLKSLLTDIKSKLRRMHGAATEKDQDIVNTMASIIKRLNPDKQKVNDVTYVYLKS